MKNYSKKNIINLQKLLVPNRIKILQMLLEKDTCVCILVEDLKLKHNLVSHHLKTLIDMGFVKSKRNGLHQIYHLNKDRRKIIIKLFNLINF